MVAEKDGLAVEGDAMVGAMVNLMKRVTPTKEAVRQVVEEVVDERLPRRLEVYRDDQILGSVNESTRPEFDDIASDVFAGINVMLVGPAGCGKTTVAHQIADALGLRFGFISLTAGISESHLLGRFIPMGDNGKFEYVPAAFVDFYENGGLFLLDEVDSADANVLLVLNAAIANGHMATPNPAKPVIKRHPDFRLVVAANTWGNGADRQYVGRNQLDAAFLDRFCAGKHMLDYDVKGEHERGGRDAKGQELVRWVHGVRRVVRDRGLRRVVSTRLIVDGRRLLDAGKPLEYVKRRFLADWSESEINMLDD